MSNTLEKVLTYISSIIVFVIFYYAFSNPMISGMAIGFLIVAIPAFLIGYFIANWYSKREKKNYTIINVISWSNVITWAISPALGIMVGIMAYKFGLSEENKKFKILGFISIMLSIINGLLGGYLIIKS